jgi:glycerol-3-phosphate acyltransferase PlsX
LVRIAVDAMGGDYAPHNIVQGAVEAARTVSRRELEITFVGDSRSINDELSNYDTSDMVTKTVHASQVVQMKDRPAASVLKKPDSSIARAMDLLRDGKVDAMFSAGSTGAATAAAWLKLKPLTGIERPALATTLPNLRGTGVLLDAGANSDCRPNHLVQFAVMGHVFARDVLGIQNPRVGLMNIGEESTKGNDLTREVFKLLETKNLNFIGNIEGRNVFDGTVDVIVCDGFVGNVILKASESLAYALDKTFRDEIMKSPLRRLGAFLVKPAFRSLRKKVDYVEYGGAPLLGVNGVCVVGHGRSSPRAVANAIAVAARFIHQNVNEHLVRAIHDAEYAPSQAEQPPGRPGIRRRMADRLSALKRSAQARKRPGKAFGGR